MHSVNKLDRIITKNKSLLCVGLDTDKKRLPRILLNSRDPLYEFNKRIINATKDLVCAYKLNSAFYEALGWKGLRSMEKTIRIIPSDIVIIFDVKRGDIGNSSTKYAEACYNYYKVDSVTLSPYMGYDSVEPFLHYKNKLNFILCLTSNKGARNIQLFPRTQPLYLRVAQQVKKWSSRYNNCGMVMGGTYPGHLQKIRKKYSDFPLLIPGIGKQKAQISKVVRNGVDKNGSGIIINASRSILYASSGNNFDLIARRKAKRLKNSIETAKKSIKNLQNR